MARFADGRSASVLETPIIATAGGLSIRGEPVAAWRTFARADDGGAAVVLRRIPDTGERITLTEAEANEVRALAPRLFTGRALRRDHPLFLASLAAIAGSLAALLLVGVPMAAEPLSAYVPPRYSEQLTVLAQSQVDAITRPCGPEGDTTGWIALEQLFDKLQAQSTAPKARFTLVDADFPNAITLPDGSIVLTNKMVALAGSPDELAGVLAHELGHVQARHVMAGVVRQMGLGLFVDIVLGGAGAGQAMAAANLLALRFTRDDEAEADAIALNLMDRAGYTPAAMGTMFQRLAAVERQRHSNLPVLLSSHPDTLARAAHALRFQRPSRGPALNAEDWAAVRRLCPPAGAPAAPAPEPVAERAPATTMTQPVAGPAPRLEGAEPAPAPPPLSSTPMRAADADRPSPAAPAPAMRASDARSQPVTPRAQPQTPRSQPGGMRASDADSPRTP